MSLLRSTRLRVCMTLAALLLVAAEARAAKELRWKFKEGDKLPYAMSQTATILIDANGIEIDVKIKQIMDVVWTVKSVASDGTAEISQKVERVQLLMNTPFTGEVSYDSKQPDKVPPPELWDRMGKPIEAMLDGEFTLKISPTGKVSDVTLPEALTEALGEQRGGGGGQMMMGGGMFTESTIRQTIEQAVTPLPEEPAGEGVTWSRELENKMGPIGTQKIAVTYSYAGQENKDGKDLEKIDAKTEISFEAAEGGDADVAMEITEQEGKGSVLFDAAAGRAISAKTEQDLVLEGDFQGNEFAQEINMVLQLAAGTSENLPADEAPKDDAAEGDTPDGDNADKEGSEGDK